ncbi:MAG: Crp/Fnr family transcriptional regulator [Parvibaculaceae bacterium]
MSMPHDTHPAIHGTAAVPRPDAHDNWILSALAADCRDAIESLSRPAGFRAGEAILAPGPVGTLHFIESGLASLLYGAGCKQSVEVGTIGRNGCLGVRALFGIGHVDHSAVCILPVRTRAIAIGDVERACRSCPELRRRLFAFFQLQIRQSMQVAACNAQHSVEERLARWILSTSDLLGETPLAVTHERVAQLLGVRRVTVTLALQNLEARHGIRSFRRRISIRDRARLEQLACGCYRIGRMHGEIQRSGQLLDSAQATT